jgi:hypothetical protein
MPPTPSRALNGLPPNVTVTVRMRSNAVVHGPTPPRTGKRGRPRRQGERLGSLAELAAAGGFEQVTTAAGTSAVKVVVGQWYSSTAASTNHAGCSSGSQSRRFGGIRKSCSRSHAKKFWGMPESSSARGTDPLCATATSKAAPGERSSDMPSSRQPAAARSTPPRMRGSGSVRGDELPRVLADCRPRRDRPREAERQLDAEQSSPIGPPDRPARLVEATRRLDEHLEGEPLTVETFAAGASAASPRSGPEGGASAASIPLPSTTVEPLGSKRPRRWGVCRPGCRAVTSAAAAREARRSVSRTRTA